MEWSIGGIGRITMNQFVSHGGHTDSIVIPWDKGMDNLFLLSHSTWHGITMSIFQCMELHTFHTLHV